MQFWRRWLGGRGKASSSQQGERMTETKIDFSLRIYWMRVYTERQWTQAQMRELHAKVVQVVQNEGFEKNFIERRYRVDGLDGQAHSGASLLALIEVLNGLIHYIETEGQ